MVKVMSIIDKLKSVFVVVDGESETVKSVVDEPEQEQIMTNVSPVNKSDIQGFIDVLFKAMENNNMEGFDYLEFMQSISNIKKQNLTGDEIKLFQTAYALASTMKVTKSGLLESGKYYLQILEKEKSSFYNSLNNNANVKLDEKNKEINDLQKKMSEDKAKLESLKNSIVSDEEKFKVLSQDLVQAQQKVNNVKTGFNQAYSSIADKINSDLSKIEKYL